jgi:hypothetical protein
MPGFSQTAAQQAFGRRRGVALLLIFLSAQCLAEATPEPADGALNIPSAARADGAFRPSVIHSMSIYNGNIFDLTRPDENKFLYRLANKAHITTRDSVIAQQLLFEEGEVLTKNALEESERILRSNRYIQDARIETIQRDDGMVDVEVHTSDVWTLVPKFSWSRSGGKNKAAIGLKESNLLGTGMSVEASYKSDVDRSGSIFKFSDEHLFDSWYSFSAAYAYNSDGHTRFLDLRKPFYSLDSEDAWGVTLLDDDRIDSLYDQGDVVGQYEHEEDAFELFRGWSKGLQDGWTKRYLAGVATENHRFSESVDGLPEIFPLPEDRTFNYPFVGIEFLQNRFEKTKNLDQVNRTEDRFLGTRLSARLGYASTGLGSSQNAWMFNVAAQKGFGSPSSNMLIVNSNVSGRKEQDGIQNLTVSALASYYRRQSDKRLFYASVGGTIGHNLDIDNQLMLGGDTGLRGYPLRYRSGDKIALLTLEQRYFTDWYPFRLFRVGGAVFFDMGKTWAGPYQSANENEVLKDVGFGLRLGNMRSGEGRVAHIDIAFPLDGDERIKNVQFLVQTRKSF